MACNAGWVVAGGRDGRETVWRPPGLRRAGTLACRADSGCGALGIVSAVAVAAGPRTCAEDKDPRWPRIVTACTDGTVRAWVLRRRGTEYEAECEAGRSYYLGSPALYLGT